MIKSWSYSTYGLHDFYGVKDIDIMPLAGFPKTKAKIIGVSSNIMDSIYHDYYLPTDYSTSVKNYTTLDDNSWKYDGITPIFEPSETQKTQFDPHRIITNNGFYPINEVTYKVRRVVIPVGLTDATGLGVETPSLLDLNAHGNIVERINVTSTARKVSGFAFSQYNTITFINHHILMSMENFKGILDQARHNVLGSYDEIEIKKFLKYETPVV